MSFKSETKIDRRRTGESLARILADRSTYNAPSEEIATVKRHLARNLDFAPFDWAVVDQFDGLICETEDDGPLHPNDPRYEIRRSRPKWSIAQNELLNEWEEDKREVEWNRVIIATNLEEPSGSHDLPVDMPVHVFGYVIEKAAPVIHYFFRRVNAPFLVKVTQTGGSDGDDSNPCSYTYSVFAGDGSTSLGTSIAVIGPRPNGKTTAPSAGSDALAIYKSGDLKLWSTLEKPTDDNCS